MNKTYNNDNIRIIAISRNQWQRYKRIRIKALELAPYAFSSKYEDAIKRDDDSWEKQSEDLAKTYRNSQNTLKVLMPFQQILFSCYV